MIVFAFFIETYIKSTLSQSWFNVIQRHDVVLMMSQSCVHTGKSAIQVLRF